MWNSSFLQAEETYKRKNAFFAWLDKNPTKAQYTEWGGAQNILDENNKANPDYCLRNKKELSRWLNLYRQVNNIKVQYIPTKAIERLRQQGMIEIKVKV